jgi:hypothetical protein
LDLSKFVHVLVSVLHSQTFNRRTMVDSI